MEFDNIQISNLHRQYLYLPSEIGKNKIDIGVEKLKSINSKVQIVSFPTPISSVFEIIRIMLSASYHNMISL